MLELTYFKFKIEQLTFHKKFGLFLHTYSFLYANGGVYNAKIQLAKSPLHSFQRRSMKIL